MGRGQPNSSESPEPETKKARMEDGVDPNLGGFDLRVGVKFHFYSSFPPCGDATIAPKSHDDVHRTGAKCPQEQVRY